MNISRLCVCHSVSSCNGRPRTFANDWRSTAAHQGLSVHEGRVVPDLLAEQEVREIFPAGTTLRRLRTPRYQDRRSRQSLVANELSRPFIGPIDTRRIATARGVISSPVPTSALGGDFGSEVGRLLRLSRRLKGRASLVSFLANLSNGKGDHCPSITVSSITRPLDQ